MSALALFSAAQYAAAQAPHIIFILTDDNGWAGVGYNNPALHTPTLDAMAADGLTLTSQYVYQFCAPTRGSFLTGRLPYRLASTKKNFIPWQTFNMELRAGTQVCRFKEKIKASSLKYIKLEIMSTHNAN